MGNPGISVVIPVCNGEDYLAECLDSVLMQTEKDIEIICVNDEPTDGSRSILEDYSKHDARIRIIDKYNGGQASARNAGLDAAMGDYVYYLDSDDIVRTDALKLCKETADSEQLDVLCFDGLTVYENEELRKVKPRFDGYLTHGGRYQGIMAGPELFNKMVQNNMFEENVCVQFSRRTFLLENDLRFVEGIVFENAVYTMRLLLLSKRVMHIPEGLYTRRVRADSTTTEGISARRIYGSFICLKKMMDFLQSYDFTQDVFESAKQTLISRQAILADEYNKTTEEQRQALKEMLSIHEELEFSMLAESIAAERTINNDAIKDLAVKESALQNIEKSRSYRYARRLSMILRTIRRS